MERGHVRTVHPTIWTMAGAGLVVVLVIITASQIQGVRDRRAIAHIESLAKQVSDPAQLIPLTLHHDCHGDGLIRCGWTTNTDVDGLAAQASAQLTRVAHQTAQTKCFDLRGTTSAHGRSCTVQFVDGSHAVSISFDPYVRQVDGTLQLLGSNYVLMAD